MDFSVDTLMTWLEASAGDPLLLGTSLAVATLVTEDGALVAGSLLVGAGLASPLLAIAALAFGITAGDIALYGVGWSARSSRFIRRHLPINKSRSLRRWLLGKETGILFLSRFTPGARLITYVTFGFLKLSLVRFVTVMTIASLIWVTCMVLFISEVQQVFSAFGNWIGMAAAITISICIILAMRIFMKNRGLVPALQAEESTDQKFEDRLSFEGNNDSE